jgi:hypothetical protein
VQRKGDCPVRRALGLVKTTTQLDVYVLIECPGQSITGGGNHTPPTAIVSRVGNDCVVRGIAETKKRESFQRAIQRHNSLGSAASDSEGHSAKLWPSRDLGEISTRTGRLRCR